MSIDSNKNDTTLLFRNLLKFETKSASIYMLATFLTQFGSFLIVPFFWQKLSISDYGIIAIIDIIGSFLGMFLGLQLDLSITRFYYDWDDQERKKQVGNIWVISWASTLFLGVISIYVFSLISGLLFKDISFYPFVFLGLISIIINRLSIIPFATIRIVNKPLLYAFYSILSFIIQMGLNVYYVMVLDQKLYGLFISNIIGSIVSGVLGGLIMLRFAIPCMKFNQIKEPLKFALPQIPASTISGITNLLDRYLLQRFAPLEVLGVYSLCLKFTNLILHLHNAIKISFIPFMLKAIKKDKELGIMMVTKMRLFYILPLLIFGLAISLYIKDFVFWINKPDYFPIVDWVAWLVIPVLFSTFTVYFAPGLFIKKRSDLTWIPAIIQLVVVLICGLLFIPQFKMGGVVISRYASVLSLFLSTFILSEKYFPVPVKWLKISLMLGLLISFIFISNLLGPSQLLMNIVFNSLLIFIFSFISLSILIGFSKMYSLVSIAAKKNIE